MEVESDSETIAVELEFDFFCQVGDKLVQHLPHLGEVVKVLGETQDVVDLLELGHVLVPDVFFELIFVPNLDFVFSNFLTFVGS